MTTMHPHRTEVALRGLCAGPASAFGARLLALADGPVITFLQFVEAARDMVRAEPEATATWLAALVALEMRKDAPPPHTAPSRN